MTAVVHWLVACLIAAVSAAFGLVLLWLVVTFGWRALLVETAVGLLVVIVAGGVVIWVDRDKETRR